MIKIQILFIAFTLLLAPFSFAIDAFDLIHRSDLNGLKSFLEKNPEAYKATNAKQETLLTNAARSGEVEIVKFLAKKMDVNDKDKSGHTALYSAVSNSQEKTALALIELKADLKFQYDGPKDNILHVASRSGALKVIDELLIKSPDLLNQSNGFGETPLFETVRASQSKAARVLILAGAKKDVKNKKNQTPLDLIDPKADKKMYRIFRNREEP